MLNLIKDWAPFLVPLLALLAGGGWLQYYLNQRRSQRERFRTVLEDFLLPFEAILKTTKQIFDTLRNDIGNGRWREIDRHQLQVLLDSLPNADPRKYYTKGRFELLQKENGRAIDLIEKFYGRIVLPEFKGACDEFLIHAKEWQVVWNALIDSETVGPLDPLRKPNAPPFPVGLENALHNEIAEVTRRAGQ